MVNRFFAACVACLFVSSFGSEIAFSQQFRVVIKADVIEVANSDVTTAGGQAPKKKDVTIGDVATVVGADSNLRDRVLSLELDWMEDGKNLSVSKRQIAMRLLIAGYSRRDFSVSGPDEFLVTRQRNSGLRIKVEELIELEICRQFSRPIGSVDATLVSPEQLKSIEKDDLNTKQAPVVILPERMPVGRSKIEIEFENARGLRFMQSYDVTVVVRMQVAVSKERIPRGEEIKPSMIQLVERPITKRADFAEPMTLVGSSATRDIAPHQVVLSSFVGKTRQQPVRAKKEQLPIMVRTSDFIDVIAIFGKSEVRLKNAKALSSGRSGEVITVLNPRSNKRFTATVVGHRLAKVATANRR